jgi:hypothetical protein
MTDKEYNDHDLLIVIAERTRAWGDRLSSVEDRLGELEKGSNTQGGFIAGVNWLWSLVVASPGFVAMYLGSK